MNPQNAISELQERYENIVKLNSDKAFFIGLSKYVTFSWQILSTFYPIYLELRQRIDKANQEFEELYAQNAFALADEYNMNPKIAEDKNINNLITRAKDVYHKFSTDVDYAWIALGWFGMYLDTKDEWKKYNKEIPLSPLMGEITNHIDNTTNIYQNYNAQTFINPLTKQFFSKDNLLTYLVIIHEFFIKELKKLENDIFVSFLPNQTLRYDETKHLVFFKIKNAIDPEIVDFSKAPTEYTLFEIFWESKIEQGKNTLTIGEITAEYKNRMNKDVSTHHIASIIANIRKRIREKELIFERFKFIPHNGKSWTMEVF